MDGQYKDRKGDHPMKVFSQSILVLPDRTTKPILVLADGTVPLALYCANKAAQHRAYCRETRTIYVNKNGAFEPTEKKMDRNMMPATVKASGHVL